MLAALNNNGGRSGQLTGNLQFIAADVRRRPTLILVRLRRCGGQWSLIRHARGPTSNGNFPLSRHTSHFAALRIAALQNTLSAARNRRRLTQISHFAPRGERMSPAAALYSDRSAVQRIHVFRHAR